MVFTISNIHFESVSLSHAEYCKIRDNQKSSRKEEFTSDNEPDSIL